MTARKAVQLLTLTLPACLTAGDSKQLVFTVAAMLASSL
jgi:hypothetical protein